MVERSGQTLRTPQLLPAVAMSEDGPLPVTEPYLQDGSWDRMSLHRASCQKK